MEFYANKERKLNMFTAREANLKTRQICKLKNNIPKTAKQALKYCEEMANHGDLSCCFDINPAFADDVTKDLVAKGFEVDPIIDNKDHDLIIVCWYHNNAKTGDYAYKLKKFTNKRRKVLINEFCDGTIQPMIGCAIGAMKYSIDIDIGDKDEWFIHGLLKKLSCAGYDASCNYTLDKYSRILSLSWEKNIH